MNLYNFCLFVTFFQRNKNKREVVSKLGPCMYREEEINIYIYIYIYMLITPIIVFNLLVPNNI
jgi:hypothetical protein